MIFAPTHYQGLFFAGFCTASLNVVGVELSTMRSLDLAIRSLSPIDFNLKHILTT